MNTKNFIFLILCVLLSSSLVFAQVPEGMNYQGVLRDSNGDIQTNETVDVRFTILDGGSSVFTETHSGISTNAFGLINLEVGSQNTTDFGTIDWSSGSKELQVEVDAGNGFEDLGTSELLSVPYALNANGTWTQNGSDLNYTSGDVFVGRTSSVSGSTGEVFGIGGNASAGNYIGMYVDGSDPASQPYYGYATNGTFKAFTYYDGATDKWHLYNGDERLTVQEDGNVGIGTAAPNYKLQVNGKFRADTVFVEGEDIILKNLGTLSIDADFAQTDASLSFDIGNNNAGDHWDDVVAVDFVTFSDRNVKKDIKAIDYGLSDIMQLNPVSYIYKNTPGNEVKNGLIAQEVLNVYPDAVNQYDWDYSDETGKMEREKVEVLGISYSEFVPLLIKGMQEQQTTIQDLESELQALQSEIENLKNR